MKNLLLCLLGISVSFSLFSQSPVVFDVADYPEIGDEFNLIRYYTNEDEDMVPFEENIGNGPWHFDDSLFEEHIYDTIRYEDPAQYDPENVYPEADMYMSGGGTIDYFIKKTDDDVTAIGFMGDLFGMGTAMNLQTENPLTMHQFPMELDAGYQDDGNAFRRDELAAFEAIIPPDYYDQVSTYIDSIEISLFVTHSSEFIAEDIAYVSHRHTVHSDHTCLLERVQSNRLADINVRLIVTGTWMPLADVPGIGDQLPVDLPYLDTVSLYRWWNPVEGIPIV